MPLSSYTLVALARRLARELGAIRAEGTAASATATVVTDTVNLVTFPANDDAIGYEFVIISDGGTGNEGVSRWVNDSVGSATYTITVASVTGMNTTTPVYMVLDPRIATYQSLTDAIRAAVESVIHIQLPIKYNAELRVNDITMGEGGAERWTAGTSVAPDGFTAVGAGAAVAQETSIIDAPHDGGDFGALYSAKLTAAISTFTELTWRPSSRYYVNYQGRVFAIKGRVYCTTADRARLKLYDGVTSSVTDYKDATARFSKLEKTGITVSADATDFYGCIEIASGASISAYLDNLRIISADPIYDYILPASFTSIAEVWLGGENEREFNFATLVPNHLWDVFKGSSNDRIRFRPNMYLPEDRRILLIGQADVTIPSAATNNIDVSPEYVISFAKSQIYYRNGKIAEGDRWYGISQRQRDDLASSLLPNSKVVERL